jgi:hypothetical protein
VYRRDPREVQNLFVDPEPAQRVGTPLVPLNLRYAVCRDLAGALAFLHRHDIVVGDTNARTSCFVRPGWRRSCWWTATRFRGSAAVTRQLNALDWDSPEGGTVLTTATDLNNLACSCYGYSTQASKPPHPGNGAAPIQC